MVQKMYNGIINVYKEAGFTSFDVVAKLRGILKQKKIGHTGTLDPDAVGVLPVCLGKGTKLCDMLTDKNKIYKAVLLFGKNTDTEDISGKVLNEMSIEEMQSILTEDKVKEAIMSFVGEYNQIPPMYSAIKVNGKKLYELAREGVVIERKPREVFIYSIDIEKIDFPRVHFTVKCSKGTYIRSLCRDIAEKLSVCGCMEKLIRTKVSIFDIDESLTLEQIEELVKKDEISSYIKKIDDVFDECEKLYVKSEFSKLAHNGNGLTIDMVNEISNPINGELYRVYDDEKNFIGIYQYEQEENKLRMIKMFYEA